MNIRICSDLHLETRDYKKAIDEYLPFLETDIDSVLIVAGDLGYITNSGIVKEFFRAICRRFKAIIYVLGNHCWYNNCDFPNMPTLKLPKNVYLLNNDYILIDDVLFLGATLWTNFNNSPLYMFEAERFMNDYEYIKKKEYRRISAEDVLSEHNKSREYIKRILSSAIIRDKTIVVTHHMPSLCAIHERYIGSSLNYAFASNLEDIILEYKPDIWVSGHTHTSYDMHIDKTRIVCNSVGYPGEFQSGYNKNFIINI